MNISKSTVRLLLALAACAATLGAAAQTKPVLASAQPAAAAATGAGTQYSAKGADTCLDCHDKESDTATHTTADIFKSKHAQRGNARSPFAKGGLQCEACHGPGNRHADKNSKQKLNIISHKRDSYLSVQERNEPCLSCHQGNGRNAWHVGAHDRNDLACTNCHKMQT